MLEGHSSILCTAAGLPAVLWAQFGATQSTELPVGPGTADSHEDLQEEAAVTSLSSLC